MVGVFLILIPQIILDYTLITKIPEITHNMTRRMKKFLLLILLVLTFSSCSTPSPETIPILQQINQEYSTSTKNTIEQKNNETIQQNTDAIIQKQSDNNINTKSIEQNYDVPQKNISSTSTYQINTEDEMFKITTLIVNGETYTQPFIIGKTIYEFMKILALSPIKYFNFSTKEYGGIGHFVQEINGLEENVKDKMYWIYYINGQPAQIGISDYIIQQGDIIEWKYEKAKF
ncbi:MAG: DUF4430 domain-containing protein [Candidatus Magasanikbacteria bacterium]|nr:DUF4430 domain-containing protein [Candidatus Magasanikbacteria bacterium]